MLNFSCVPGLRLGGTSTAGVGGGLFGTTPGLGGGTAVSNTGFSTPLFNRVSTSGGMALGGGLGLGSGVGAGLGMSGIACCEKNELMGLRFVI